MWIKKIKSLFAFIFFCFATQVMATTNVDMQDPYKMLTTVAQDTFNEIKSNKDKLQDRTYRINLIKEQLMPYVDITYAAYKVMGNNYKKATKEQRSQFVNAFKEYVISSYADVLSGYTTQELVLPAYKKIDNSKESLITIKFIIREQGKQDLDLIFKLRKNSKTDEWRVFDMVAENISMLQAKESELTPIIREQGIDAAIKLLQAKQ